MAGIGESVGEPFQRFPAVRCHRQRHAAVQRLEALQLGAPENVVGQKNIGEAGIGHHLGLADLLAGDADRAGRNLLLRPVGQLVGLDMRPELQSMAVGMRLRPLDVGFGAGGIDQDRRRIEVVYAAHGIVTLGICLDLWPRSVRMS